MYMLPEFEKLQVENNWLKVALHHQESIINTSKNDLMKLDNANKELNYKLRDAIDKVEHEARIRYMFQEQKKEAEKKLGEAVDEKKKVDERNTQLKEEAKQKELKIQELEKRLSEYESGSTFNQNIQNAVMQKFFNSQA